MFFVVFLANSKRVLVPSNWVHRIADFKTLLINYGIPYLKGKTFKIFVSPKMDDEPDFNLEISQHFIHGRRACYSGKIKYSFGMISKDYYLFQRANTKSYFYRYAERRLVVFGLALCQKWYSC